MSVSSVNQAPPVDNTELPSNPPLPPNAYQDANGVLIVTPQHAPILEDDGIDHNPFNQLPAGRGITDPEKAQRDWEQGVFLRSPTDGSDRAPIIDDGVDAVDPSDGCEFFY